MEYGFASGGRAFAMDDATGQLSVVRREAVPLSARQSALLRYFLANPNRQLSVPEIEAAVWGGEAPDGAVHHAVRALMTALGDDEDRPLFIEALAQRGYRFLAGVEGASAQPAPTDPRSVLGILSDASGLPHPSGLADAVQEAKRLGRVNGADEHYAGAAEALGKAARSGERLPPMALETVMDALSGWAA